MYLDMTLPMYIYYIYPHHIVIVEDRRDISYFGAFERSI